ncbi:hypothetical protein L873DRAFT_759871 [Choiromyces venosus 120613-1]|uniref:Uncharacterized protein n=1 Tax=Choiromyces venosus 120613-1 TaxID=1336337 RepID=A0A3N4JQR5_9PEZI|nr:hypothetical protein L873DRAFT_759871 [Choiromyces venosus 120613-1]
MKFAIPGPGCVDSAPVRQWNFTSASVSHRWANLYQRAPVNHNPLFYAKISNSTVSNWAGIKTSWSGDSEFHQFLRNKKDPFYFFPSPVSLFLSG